MMIQRLGDDPAAVDYGEVATWGWYGAALMLAIIFLGPRLMGGKTRKRRK